MKQRFQHQGYKIVTILENLLLKSAKNENYQEELKIVTEFYGSDLNKDSLEAQLLTFTAKFKELKAEKVNLDVIVEFMKRPGYSDLVSEHMCCQGVPAILYPPRKIFDHKSMAGRLEKQKYVWPTGQTPTEGESTSQTNF